MLDINTQNRITRLENEVQALRGELRSLRADLNPMLNPRTKTRHQPTPERNLAPERAPEALTDVAQQLSEQVSMEEIGAYLKRRRVSASDIQLTEQDLQRNRPRNRRAHAGYLGNDARIEFFWDNARLFTILFFLIMALLFLLIIL